MLIGLNIFIAVCVLGAGRAVRLREVALRPDPPHHHLRPARPQSADARAGAAGSTSSGRPPDQHPGRRLRHPGLRQGGQRGRGRVRAGRHQRRGSSDTIMLVHLDPAARTASLLSIPRDLWVPIAGTGPQPAHQHRHRDQPRHARPDHPGRPRHPDQPLRRGQLPDLPATWSTPSAASSSGTPSRSATPTRAQHHQPRLLHPQRRHGPRRWSGPVTWSTTTRATGTSRVRATWPASVASSCSSRRSCTRPSPPGLFNLHDHQRRRRWRSSATSPWTAGSASPRCSSWPRSTATSTPTRRPTATLPTVGRQHRWARPCSCWSRPGRRRSSTPGRAIATGQPAHDRTGPTAPAVTVAACRASASACSTAAGAPARRRRRRPELRDARVQRVDRRQRPGRQLQLRHRR